MFELIKCPGHSRDLIAILGPRTVGGGLPCFPDRVSESSRPPAGGRDLRWLGPRRAAQLRSGVPSRRMRIAGWNRTSAPRPVRDQVPPGLEPLIRALGQCAQAVAMAGDETAYLREVCRIVTLDCGCAMAWVGYFEHDPDQSIGPRLRNPRPPQEGSRTQGPGRPPPVQRDAGRGTGPRPQEPASPHQRRGGTGPVPDGPGGSRLGPAGDDPGHRAEGHPPGAGLPGPVPGPGDGTPERGPQPAAGRWRDLPAADRGRGHPPGAGPGSPPGPSSSGAGAPWRPAARPGRARRSWSDCPRG
jgi:hypothetical protein